MMSEIARPRAIMAGKRGLILGVANEKSIAWGIASTVAAQGAELAFTYQNDAIKRRVEPLAGSVGSDMVMPCDVANAASLDAVTAAVAERWGRIDFAVHAVAYSDKAELKGRYCDTSRANFLNTLRSEEHTSELQSLMRISSAVLCLNKKNQTIYNI